MPTGYTDPLHRGVHLTFAEFAWSCARAMDALCHLRDEPMGAPSLDRAIAGGDSGTEHHRAELAKAGARLVALERMTPQEMQAELSGRHARLRREYEEAVDRKRALRQRYQGMLDQVLAWTPPTDEHAGLRDFMAEQLTSSIKHDCHAPTPPTESTLDDYRRAELEYARWRVDYQRERLQKSEERHAGRRAWVEALHASIPCPRVGEENDR